jgi:hypothetical protein
VAFITPMALRAGAIGYYYTNKTYIASQLCVNQDNKLPAYLKSIEKDVFNQHVFLEPASVCFSKISNQHKPYHNSYNFIHQSSIFQPPSFS